MFEKLKEKKTKKRNRRIYLKNELLYQEILKSILREEYDFIAFAVSHWHAIGVDAFVYEISKKIKKKPVGIIIISSHQKDGFVVSEKDFICKDFSKIDFCFLNISLDNLSTHNSIKLKTYNAFKKFISIFTVIYKIKKQNNSNKKRLYIVSVMNPMINFLQIFNNKSINKKYLPIFSLIDEGIGTFAPKKIWKIVRNMDTQSNKPIYLSFGKNLELNIRGMVINFLKKLALKYISTERRFLLYKKGSNFIPNWEVVNSYKNVLLKRNTYFKNIKKLPYSIIIVTTPYSEYKLSSLKYELNILEKVIDLSIAKGFNVVIKPHPRETPNKYLPILIKYESKNVEIIRGDFPIEDLFISLKPLCVIGYGSTALLNANIIFEIPAISISSLFLNNGSEEINKNLLGKLNKNGFEKIAKDYVYNIENFKKLEKVLNLIILKSQQDISDIIKN